MKRFFIMALYWFLASLTVALILVSLDYSFGDALMLGVLLLPGCLASRFFIPKITAEKKGQKAFRIICFILVVLLTDVLLIIWYHLIRQRMSIYTPADVDPMLLNPVFLAVIMAIAAYGDHALSEYLRRNGQNVPQTVTFTSEYRKMTLVISEIMYIESRDTEVWIHATEGRIFRNRTPISQWQNILDVGFVRIHRSYLVNLSHVSSNDGESVTVNDEHLPISRKNKEKVLSSVVQDDGFSRTPLSGR